MQNESSVHKRREKTHRKVDRIARPGRCRKGQSAAESARRYPLLLVMHQLAVDERPRAKSGVTHVLPTGRGTESPSLAASGGLLAGRSRGDGAPGRDRPKASPTRRPCPPQSPGERGLYRRPTGLPPRDQDAASFLSGRAILRNSGWLNRRPKTPAITPHDVVFSVPIESTKPRGGNRSDPTGAAANSE